MLVGGEFLQVTSQVPTTNAIADAASVTKDSPVLAYEDPPQNDASWWDSALQAESDQDDLPEDYQALANLFFADLD